MSERPPADDDGRTSDAAAPPAGDTVVSSPEGASGDATDAGSGTSIDRTRTRRMWIAIAAAVALVIVVVTIATRPRDPAGAGEAPEIATGDGGAALRSPAVPRLPDAGTRLTGYVVDGTNAPVVGAEVTAEPERGIVDRSLQGASDAGLGPTSTIVKAPATGDDGHFVLAGLAPGRYRIRVTGPGLLPAEVRYVPVPSDEARIVVARRVSIAGRVVDGGTPVANANVGVRGEVIGGGLELRTDAKGAFRFDDLPEGRYQLFAWHDTLAARAVRVNRLGAGPFPPLELSLEAAAVVVGRVIDRDEGTGIIAAIELRPVGDDQAPRYARSARDGTFRIEGVPHGRWIADAFSPGYVSPGGVELEAGRAIPELALARGAVVEGRVVDGDGQPIANAAVRALTTGPAAALAARPQASEYSADVDQDRLRRFSGRIAVVVAPVGPSAAADPQLLPRGELGVMVGPIPPIPPPGAQIARPASLDTTATAFVGEPEPLPIEPATASIWTTGPDGRYRIRGLPPGKVAVAAVASGFADGKSKTVTLGAGQLVTDVDVALSRGTIVYGRVTDQHGAAIAGAQVHARPELGGELDVFTDDDGRYRLGPVAGTVELTASAFGHADTQRTLELTVASVAGGNGGLRSGAGERREDLVLQVADAVLAGTLDDEGGAAIAGAQLEIVSTAGGGRRAVSAADGTFAIELLPAGRVRVRITHPAYPTIELEAQAAPHDRARVRLRVPLGGAVEGVVLDNSSGGRVGGIVLSAYGPLGDTTDTTTDSDGAFRLGPLRPGRWKLAIEQPGYVAFAREVDVPVSRAPGETSLRDVRIDLMRGALVGGTVRDGRGNRVADATVTVQAATGGGPTVTGSTDARGEFRIRDAPAGDLVVHVTSGDREGSLRVTLRSGDEVLGLAIELR